MAGFVSKLVAGIGGIAAARLGVFGREVIELDSVLNKDVDYLSVSKVNYGLMTGVSWWVDHKKEVMPPCYGVSRMFIRPVDVYHRRTMEGGFVKVE